RDPLELIAAWRRERRLLVETPALRYMPAGDEREAIHLAPGLRATLRGFLSRPAPFTELPGPPTASPEELARLAELALATRLPPRAPVVLAVRWPGYGLEGAAR